MSETDLSRAIRKALGAMGIPCERVQSGRVRVKGGFLTLAGEGTPDIVTPYGWLEIKLPGEKPRENQLSWHQAWQAQGAKVAVVASVAEAVRIVREWQEQRSR